MPILSIAMNISINPHETKFAFPSSYLFLLIVHHGQNQIPEHSLPSVHLPTIGQVSPVRRRHSK